MSKLINLIWTPERHEDSRRKIVDVSSRVKLFTIADVDGLKLGNHYHERTPESFYTLDGRIHFKLEDIQTKEKQEYVLESGQGISMPLFVAHLLIPERGARFIGILGTDFDPTDLNKYEIIW